jgi:hypothetical protein
MAGRAMPVSATAWNRMLCIAVITFIENGPERASPAITHIPDNLFMDSGHPVTIQLQVILAIGPEYLLNPTHDSTPCIIWATFS